MQSINSLSLAPAVSDWLSKSRYPRILHVFDHACNLINERREILSIVTQQIGNGPFNLVVEADVCFSDSLDLESPISNSASQLDLGGLCLNTTNAKLWCPRPDWGSLHGLREDILHQLMSLRMSNPGRGNLQINEEIASSPQSRHLRLNQQLLATTFSQLQITNYQSPLSTSLVSAVAAADISSAKITTSRLAGLGVGLTPAGDDFIMGAVYAAWIIHPHENASILAQEIANTAAPLTASLSGAWLKCAGRGEAGVLWHEFFDAMISENPARIQEATEKILAVGETSGADALAGFIGSFVSWMEEAGPGYG
jgi:hypothetical protein